MFAAVSSRLMDRHDAKEWVSHAPDQINALSEDQAGLDQLMALVRDNNTRLEELSDSERAAIETIITAKRDNIERGIIRGQAEAALNGPDSPETVSRITALLPEIHKSKLPAEEQASLIMRAGSKAVGILLPPIEEAAVRAAQIPASLDGLATAMTAA